jgi:hypothetical protein
MPGGWLAIGHRRAIRRPPSALVRGTRGLRARGWSPSVPERAERFAESCGTSRRLGSGCGRFRSGAAPDACVGASRVPLVPDTVCLHARSVDRIRRRPWLACRGATWRQRGHPANSSPAPNPLARHRARTGAWRSSVRVHGGPGHSPVGVGMPGITLDGRGCPCRLPGPDWPRCRWMSRVVAGGGAFEPYHESDAPSAQRSNTLPGSTQTRQAKKSTAMKSPNRDRQASGSRLSPRILRRRTRGKGSPWGSARRVSSEVEEFGAHDAGPPRC